MAKDEKNALPNETDENEAAAAEKPKKNLKKLKYGSASVVVTVLVTAIVVILNLICSIISQRSPIKLDLTPDKRYELSEESIEALKNLDKDVEITVTFQKEQFTSMSSYYKQYYAYYGYDVETPYDVIPSILEKYELYAEQGSGSVTVKYVDMNKDPDIISKYKKAYNGDITEGCIVVYSDNNGEGRVKLISQQDIIQMIQADSTSSSTNLSMSFVGESTITSAILNVTDSNPIKTAVVTTMNGASVSGQGYDSLVVSFEEFLSKNGYDCTEIDIASDSLNPEDYDFIVVYAPSVDFSDDIIDKLGDFLYNNGEYGHNMLYVPNLYATNLPNITEFLADWKIQIENSIIVDDTNYARTIIGQGIDDSPILSISDTTYTGTLPNESLPIISPLTKEITILSKNNDAVAAAVLESADTAYTEPLEQGGTTGETGVKNAAVISKKETSVNFDRYTSNLLVLGSSFITYDTLLQNTNTYNNANVIIGMLNTMTGKEAAAVIPEKALQQAVIAPTAGQDKGIKIFTIYIIPIIVAATGIFVFIRRKNR